MMTVVPTVSPVVSTIRRPVAVSLVAGVLVFALPLLVSCRLDQLLTPGRFAGLRIEPDTVGVADTVRLRVNMTAPLAFTSNDTSLATVDQHGVVTGRKRGKVGITAAVTGVRGVDRPASTTDTVWVVAVSVSLTRDLDTLTSVDDTTCLRTAAFDKLGDTLTAATPTITKTADPDNTLTALGGPGCYRATKSGRAATFVAQLDTAQAQVTLTVHQVVNTVQLSQHNIRMRSLAETTTIAADARDARGNPVPATLLTWSTDNAVVADVDSTGHVTATQRNGQAKVFASNSGKADTALVTVRQDAHTATIAPSPATIQTVSGVDTVRATARDSLGQPIPDSLVVFDWVSDSSTIATARTLPTGRGVLQAQLEGRARIRVSAAAGDRTAADTDSVTVQFKYGSITVTPNNDTLTSLGDTTQLTGVVRDTAGNVVPQAQIVWSSGNAAVSVDAAGRAVAHAPSGSAVTITATSRTATGTAGVLVRQLAARLVPVPATLHLSSLGQFTTLSDTAFDARDSVIASHTTTWSTDNPNVAMVNASGRVTAIGNGSTRVRGTLNAAAESVTVDVVQAAASVVMTPALDTLRTATAQVTLRAKVKDANDSTIGNPGLVWQSLATGVAQIVSVGTDTARIGAVAEGTAIIDARSGAGGGSANGTAQVVVRYKLNTLTVAPTDPKFNHLGDTLTFSASGQDSVGNTVTNPQVIWTSRTPSRLTINATTGLATAIDTGDVWVVATHDNAKDSTLAQVRPPVLIVDQTRFFADSLRLGTSEADTTYRHISNAGTFTLGAKARIAHSAAWLAITPDTLNLAATVLDSIRLIASATGLGEGLYTDTVVVTSVGAKNSPARIPVSLRVVCPTAAVAADTSISGSFAPGDCRSPQRPRSFADLYQFNGNVGDTVNIFLTTGAQTDLDTYLYLLNASGAVIASNDDCPGLGRNSCITQFPLPGGGPYKIEATTFDSAQFGYTVSLTHPVAPTAATALAQRTTAGATIAAHDSVNNTTVVLAATGNDANGRDSLRLQVEIRPVATAFTGPTDTGAFVLNATGGVPLSVTVPNLTNGTWYHWRARAVDQTGRIGPWTQFSPDSAFKVVITGPVLTVTPGSVTDTALATDTSHKRVLNIANTGGPSFSWTAAKTGAGTWLTFAPSSGPENSTLTLTMNPTGLASGTYRDTLVVTAAGATGSPDSIPVTFVVQRPILSVTPLSVSRSANAASGAVLVDTIRISNAGTGPLTWTAGKDSSWLHLSKTAGGAPDQIIDSIFVGTRPAGTYRDTVRIVSQVNDTVKVPVTLTVHQPLLVVATTPSPLTDSANVGASTLRTDTIHIANGDGGTLSWTASRRPVLSWLTISAPSGTAPSDLVVTLNPTGQSAGTLTDTVVITSTDANDSAKVLVTFNIRQPVLSVSPTSLQDSAQQGTGSKTRTLSVTNPGGGTLVWSAGSDTTWLGVAPSGGTGAGSITLTLDPAGLATGTHTGHVTVTSAGATGSPAQITVTLVITPPPFLSVTHSAPPDTAFLGSTAAKASVVQITNSGGGSLTWSATKDSTWIGLSKTSGPAPITPSQDTTILSLSPTGLTAGSRTGHVVITPSVGNPDTVPVTLVIVPCALRALLPDTLESGSLTTADCGAPHRAGSFARIYSVTANTGDTLDVKLTASFDAFLVITNGIGDTIATNDTCPGLSGTACVRNIQVPASGARIEATTAAAGATGTFSLLVTKPQQPAAPGSPNQYMANGSTQIAAGGTDTTSSVVFKGTVSDPNPRDTLRLQVELRFARDTNFTSIPTDSSAPVLPGATATITRTGLTDDSTYHWKVRACDQTSRCSPWAAFGTIGSPDTATDFKMAVPQDPFAPTDSMQTYVTGGAIAVGGTDTTDAIILKATVSDPDPGDQLKLQIERQPAGASFLNTPTATATTAVASGQVSSVTLTGQSDNTNYRWQARTIDQNGRTGPWVDFGGNGTAADYKIAIPDPPNLPDSLAQFQSDGTTPIPSGGGVGVAVSVTVVLKGRVTDPDPGDVITFNVEVTGPLGTYTGTGNAVTSGNRSATSVSVPVGTVLTPLNYTWRGRACDQTNRCSGWVNFGGNPAFHAP